MDLTSKTVGELLSLSRAVGENNDKLHNEATNPFIFDTQ
jgi:hypothetical protein